VHGYQSRYDAETIGCHEQRETAGGTLRHSQQQSKVAARKKVTTCEVSWCVELSAERERCEVCDVGASAHATEAVVPNKGGRGICHRTITPVRAAKPSGGPLSRYLVLHEFVPAARNRYPTYAAPHGYSISL
jgi:hypothetical protein